MEYREIRPFACESCELRFTTKQFLQRHYIVHTEARNYKCLFCSNSYKYKKGLNRHYKKAHVAHYTSEIEVKDHCKIITGNCADLPSIQEKSCKKPKKNWEFDNKENWLPQLDPSKFMITSPFPTQ